MYTICRHGGRITKKNSWKRITEPLAAANLPFPFLLTAVPYRFLGSRSATSAFSWLPEVGVWQARGTLVWERQQSVFFSRMKPGKAHQQQRDTAQTLLHIKCRRGLLGLPWALPDY